jgi:hypothetical protein
LPQRWPLPNGTSRGLSGPEATRIGMIPLCSDFGTVMLLLMAMLRESKRPLPARNVTIHLCPLREVGSI